MFWEKEAIAPPAVLLIFIGKRHPPPPPQMGGVQIVGLQEPEFPPSFHTFSL